MLEAGERVGVAEVGILATVGAVQLPVHRRPKVAVLSTGRCVGHTSSWMGGLEACVCWRLHAVCDTKGEATKQRSAHRSQQTWTKAVASCFVSLCLVHCRTNISAHLCHKHTYVTHTNNQPTSGDEVVDPATPQLGPGQIRDCNRSMLLAAAATAGAGTIDLGIARDVEGHLEGAVDRAIAVGADVLVTSGG